MGNNDIKDKLNELYRGNLTKEQISDLFEKYVLGISMTSQRGNMNCDITNIYGMKIASYQPILKTVSIEAPKGLNDEEAKKYIVTIANAIKECMAQQGIKNRDELKFIASTSSSRSILEIGNVIKKETKGHKKEVGIGTTIPSTTISGIRQEYGERRIYRPNTSSRYGLGSRHRNTGRYGNGSRYGQEQDRF